MIDEYKITLNYYEAGVLTDSHDTVRQIANEDDLELTLGRNMQWEGVFQEYSGTFIFTLEDRDWIIEKVNIYRSRLDRDTKIDILFYLLNPTTLAYDLDYTGRLEMKPVSEVPNYVECQFYEDNEINRVDKIQDTEITLEKNGEVYGYEISNNAVENAHQPINYDFGFFTGISYPVSEYVTMGKKQSEHTKHDDSYNSDTSIIYPIDDTTSIVAEQSLGVLLNGTVSNDGNYSVKLEAYIEYKDIASTIVTYEFFNQSGIWGGNITAEMVADASIPIDPVLIVHDPDDLANSTSVTIRAFCTVTETVPTGSTVAGAIRFSDDSKGFYFNIDGTKTSQIVGNNFRDILDDLEVELDTTINTDSLIGTPYENMIITTARGVKGIRPLNYNIKFSDIFNSMKSFMALSLSYVGSVVYINPIEDAYIDVEHYIGEATNLEILENDLIYNQLSTGNSGGGSSNFNWGDLEFNSKRLYDLGIESDTVKDFTNTVRVDGSTINKAAIDFEGVSVSIADRDDDKDLYFIAYDGVNSDVNSNFALVSGLDVDKFGKAINLEFSPSRQLYNWRNYLGHLFTGDSSFILKSWEKNKDLVYQDTDRLETVTDTPNTITSITNATPIFGKRKYIIDIAITKEIKQIIRDYPNNILTFDFDGVLYRGYLQETSVNPLIAKSGQMTLIEAS